MDCECFIVTMTQEHFDMLDRAEKQQYIANVLNTLDNWYDWVQENLDTMVNNYTLRMAITNEVNMHSVYRDLVEYAKEETKLDDEDSGEE